MAAGGMNGGGTDDETHKELEAERMKYSSPLDASNLTISIQNKPSQAILRPNKIGSCATAKNSVA